MHNTLAIKDLHVRNLPAAGKFSVLLRTLREKHFSEQTQRYWTFKNALPRIEYGASGSTNLLIIGSINSLQ